jgi:hypothetical protein
VGVAGGSRVATLLVINSSKLFSKLLYKIMPRQRKYQKRKPMRKRNNKKVTTRKAYNKNYKKQTAKMIQPIAEGRKVNFINTTSPNYLAPTLSTENWQVIVPETWKQMYRENFLDTLDRQPSSLGFTGKSLFSRYINQQVKIKFDSIKHYTFPPRFHVVYGWCKIPYITALQSQGSDSATNLNNVLIQHDPDLMIQRALAQMYNVTFPTTDPKQFKLMYNREFQVRGEDMSNGNITEVIRKDLDYRISWRPNTKYHMRPATMGDGSNGNPPPGNDLSPDDGYAAFQTNSIPTTTAYWTPSSKTNGDLWIPFFGVQVKNAENFGRDDKGNVDPTAYPYHLHKNTHYFYDL